VKSPQKYGVLVFGAPQVHLASKVKLQGLKVVSVSSDLCDSVHGSTPSVESADRGTHLVSCAVKL
jgi:hypothetical protein